VSIDIEERLTESITRARLKLELRRSIGPLVTLAVGAAIGIACWGVIAWNVGRGTLASTYTVRVAVHDATAVTAGRDDVRIHGIRVGTVTRAALVDGRPVLTLRIESRYGRLYRDARAELRPNTALQDMYVDIVDRGHPGSGVATQLPANQVRVSQNVAQVLQTFQPGVRRSLGVLLDQLGGGLDGHGDDLRAAFVQVAPTLRTLGSLTRELAVRSELTKRLVTNVSLLTGDLATRQRSLRELVEAGGTTLKTLQAGSADLDATLRELPPTLDRLDAAVVAVHGVLGDADTAVRSLGPVADRLPDALTSLRDLAGEAQPAVDALRRPVAQLTPLSSSLLPLATSASQTVGALRPQVPAIDKITTSIGDCTLAIYGFFQWTASITKYDDGKGVFPRGDAVLNTASATGLAKDPVEKPYPGCVPEIPKLAEP
jgi:phospholipid/cholesterol/gamma-HCH transport system substrate-binding protein